MANRRIQLRIEDMHCTGCEQIIEEALRRLPGIQWAKASYPTARAEVEFDDAFISEPRIRRAIEEKGYRVAKIAKRSLKHYALNGLIFFLLLLVVGGVAFWGKSLMPGLMKQMSAQVGYAMLFTIGFLTGFHCIGMCGGFVVSYSTAVAPRTVARLAAAHLLYAFGKTASYVLIGAGFGLLGSLVTITAYMRGIAALAASLFLVIYGLKMLNVFAFLRYFTLRLPRFMVRGVAKEVREQHNPLVIGLLTGLLLGCGPLQAMYIMAAGTGSPREGATILFFFGLGTLLPLLGFGLFASILSRNTIHLLVRVSGILVIIMGLMMADRGLKLIQSGYDLASLLSRWEQRDSAELHPSEPAMTAPHP
ncbi:sulfite exporter TauE/SafE family protein [Methylococcus sp. ANG]|uniref:urease accessory protein UreH domain-containing protein n=1 Tax=Methylococcus sp. ANG TaxID=3231903 RepID=UPI00345A339A